MKSELDCSKELEVILGWITNINYVKSNENDNTLIDYFVTIKNSASNPESRPIIEKNFGQNLEEYVRDSKTLFNFLIENSEQNLVLQMKEPGSFLASFTETNYATSVSHSIDFSQQYIEQFIEQSSFGEDASKRVAFNELKKYHEKLEKAKTKALINNHNITKEKVRIKNEKKRKLVEEAVEEKLIIGGAVILEDNIHAELSPIESKEESFEKPKEPDINIRNQFDANFNKMRGPMIMHPNFVQQNMFVPRFIPPIYSPNMMGYNGMFNYPINPNEALFNCWQQNAIQGNPQLMHQMQMNMNMKMKMNMQQQIQSQPINFQNNQSRFVEQTNQVDFNMQSQPNTKNNGKKHKKKAN